MLQLLSSSIPGTYSTKIWMSTELAENRDLGPLGHPYHRGVLGFSRHFITHLKIAQGLRDRAAMRTVERRGRHRKNRIPFKNVVFPRIVTQKHSYVMYCQPLR